MEKKVSAHAFALLTRIRGLGFDSREGKESVNLHPGETMLLYWIVGLGSVLLPFTSIRFTCNAADFSEVKLGSFSVIAKVIARYVGYNFQLYTT